MSQESGVRSHSIASITVHPVCDVMAELRSVDAAEPAVWKTVVRPAATRVARGTAASTRKLFRACETLFTPTRFTPTRFTPTHSVCRYRYHGTHLWKGHGTHLWKGPVRRGSRVNACVHEPPRSHPPLSGSPFQRWGHGTGTGRPSEWA